MKLSKEIVERVRGYIKGRLRRTSKEGRKESVEKGSTTQAKTRFDCIDIFRGLTISLMLMVINPGDIANFPAQLKHAAWNGVTLADFVFPFFIFIMGVVVPISINGRLEKGISRLNIVANVIRRSTFIFICGLFLNGFPTYDLTVIRVPGVLQRIAVVYLCSALIYLLVKSLFKRQILQLGVQSLIAVLLLILYYRLLNHVQVPEIAELQGGLVSYIDLKYLHGHLYTPTFDPEGILSTIPALGSGLIGVIVGMVLQRRDSHIVNNRFVKMLVLIGGGILLLVVARWFNTFFPYNKNLWTSSFVLLTSGFGVLILTALHLITDVLKMGGVLTPFKVIGASPIFVYLMSNLIGKMIWGLPIMDTISGGTMPFKAWVIARLITPWAHGLESIYFSVLYVVVWMAIMGYLYHKKIHIRL